MTGRQKDGALADAMAVLCGATAQELFDSQATSPKESFGESRESRCMRVEAFVRTVQAVARRWWLQQVDRALDVAEASRLPDVRA
jgi:hypothetical protein